jgi:hypothetical protein
MLSMSGDPGGCHSSNPVRSPAPRRVTPALTASIAFCVGLLALCAAAPEGPTETDPPGDSSTGTVPKAAEAATRLASRTTPTLSSASVAGKVVTGLSAASGRPLHASPVKLDGDPIDAAKQAILDCQARFARISDYTCTFHKRERIDGKLISPHVMLMKARNRPTSIYMKFVRPNKGREAIYVAGRNKGHVLAHDVGLFKVLAGTMLLDPKSEMAMDECRHPITEAGIGALIDTVAKHWSYELTPEGAVVSIHPNMTIGPRTVTMIESTHPTRRSDFLFHKVKLYLDHEHGLPIRFEAYDWPKRPGGPIDLVEEYTYTDLKIDVGLTDRDFDPNNRAYAFGRF